MSDRKRCALGFLLLLSLLIILVLLNLVTGSARISFSELVRPDGTASIILRSIRLPRLLAAALLGGALSLSGYLLQTFFMNPIAGPFVLGISSGAKLLVAFTMILTLKCGTAVSSITMIGAAFLGAMLSMGLILLAERKMKNMALLVVCGVMIGYICSAVTEIAVTFADDSNIVNLHNWSMGSFSGISWRDLRVAAPVTATGIMGAVLLSKPISAWQLGESGAQTVGLNIRRFRLMLILFSSLLSACVTAFAGPISFVGIAVPHLVRSLFRSAKPLCLIPACFLGGAVFCLFSDLLARVLFSPTELSISTVTAVLGAPVVIRMLLSRRIRHG